ncbi:MAG: response regulator [Rhodospirillales bacterium]|nr:response regulator [Rhodospirillales bacterium]
MRFRVLFVDDEPKVLQGLHRMLRKMRNEWEMVFAGSGQAALNVLEKEPFHAVVSDMRMPGIDGGTLLSKVAKHNPGAVRIILSGYTDEERVMKTVIPAHQFLAKPVAADQLIGAIRRAFSLRAFLGNRKLRRLVTTIESLPSPPTLYQKVVAEMDSPLATARSVANLISDDPAMVAETLKLINSPFFGVAVPISDMTRAIRLLGFERMRTLVLQVGLFRHFAGNWSMTAQLETINRQCRNIGALAAALARIENLDSGQVEEAHCAGLLSQIGAIVLLDDQPVEYATAAKHWKNGGITLGDAQAGIFGASQSELGAYLLGLWGFSDPVVEAVAFCQRPSLSVHPGLPLLPILHFVNAANRPDGRYIPLTGARNPDFDGEFMARAGMESRLPTWQKTLNALRKTLERDEIGRLH